MYAGVAEIFRTQPLPTQIIQKTTLPMLILQKKIPLPMQFLQKNIPLPMQILQKENPKSALPVFGHFFAHFV